MHISDILRSKGDGVVTVGPATSVRDLLALLAEHNIGAVVVSSDGGALDGIVSERDVVRRMTTHPDVTALTVADIMTSLVHTCEPHETVDGVMGVMTDHRIRHVPVVTDGSLQGIVSIGDVVKARMAELQHERDQLEHYIAGT